MGSLEIANKVRELIRDTTMNEGQVTPKKDSGNKSNTSISKNKVRRVID